MSYLIAALLGAGAAIIAGAATFAAMWAAAEIQSRHNDDG